VVAIVVVRKQETDTEKKQTDAVKHFQDLLQEIQQ